MARDVYTRLVYARQVPVIGKLAYYTLKLFGKPCRVYSCNSFFCNIR